ncbi:hypothetical protein GPECTOR_36g56 [Gonium pectorale]|uniref:Pheophorbide a oxygenase domain-containing protein n=1 Tax=Gonium pectorale TaxID=33097 RepID=A0A150GBV2_GONPE|nr:hypothetical protein GPECTOR_36g56 [Gonium pectorale]|eukprot:KXZ47331.1 hypothetical protein GPECTOR_36g56 [Gonium pectorale]
MLDGLLWVWPDDSPDAASASAASAPELPARLRDRAASSPAPLGWFVRELPYSYEVLVENLLDPAHLPFSHHGVVPVLQRSAGGPMPMKAPTATATAAAAGPGAATAAPTTATAMPAQSEGSAGGGAAAAPAPALPRHWARPGGPDIELDFRGNISPDATISFNAPHLITYTYRLPGGGESNVELVAIPVAPGRSRFLSPDPPQPAKGAPSRRPPMPPLHKLGLKRAANIALMAMDLKLFSHRNLNTILDGDGVFLHVQDEVVRQVEAEADAAEGSAGASTSGGGNGGAGSGAGVWSRAYYMATQADTAVLGARKWLEERAGGGPFRARARRLLSSRAPGASAGGAAANAAADVLVGSKVPGAAPSSADRRRLLDRYEQHTRHCPHCSARLDQLQRAAEAAKAVRAAALLGLCAAVGAAGALAAVQGAAAALTGWPAALVAACAALAAAATTLGRVASSWAQEFLFMDYVHAEKD